VVIYILGRRYEKCQRVTPSVVAPCGIAPHVVTYTLRSHVKREKENK
jgi:hypothetical protein